MDRDRERNAEDEAEAPAPESGGRQKLKLAAHYALLAFAPVVSVVALIVALVANGHRSDQAQIGEAAARIDKLEASLQASRAEVETLKLAAAREKSLRGDERKKDEELDEKIVQNISRLQSKLKVAPTLEEQLQGGASSPVAASHVEGGAPAPVALPPVVAVKNQAVAQPAIAEKKPSAPAAAPKAGKKDEGRKTAASPASPKKVEEKKKSAPAPAQKDQKMSPQVKALKDAINQYNKQ